MTTPSDIDDVPYGVAPLAVHVLNFPAKEQERPKEIRVSHRTIALTAANPFVLAAQVDPARIEAHVEPNTNPVIMSSSLSAASDPANQATPYVNPNGRILNNTVGEYVVPGGANEIWFTGNTFPTLVGITIVREV